MSSFHARTSTVSIKATVGYVHGRHVSLPLGPQSSADRILDPTVWDKWTFPSLPTHHRFGGGQHSNRQEQLALAGHTHGGACDRPARN